MFAFNKRLLLLLVSFLAISFSAWCQLTYLKRSTPEAEGLRSKDVLAYIDSLMRQQTTDMHGVMILRNGKVIAEKYNEPFAAEYSHTQYSASKTFTAFAVGLAIQDSLLSLTDHLVDFVPEMLPEVVGDSLAAITVEDLLTMRSGFPVDTDMRTIYSDWIRRYLSHRMVALPGTKFAYDSIDSYLLSAIVQKVTGMTVFDLLKKRLFTPLGITQVAWEESPEGVTCGGWGLYIQLESMAKFGQLLLQRGEWNGQQLINPEWIDAMTSLHVSQPNGQKYGYHIWLTDYPGMVRCDGAWGQYIFVIPDRQMVVAMTQCKRSGSLDGKATWNLSRTAKPSGVKLPVGTDYNVLKNARYRLAPASGKAQGAHMAAQTLQLSSNPLGWKRVSFDFLRRKTSYNETEPYLRLEVLTQSGETFTLDCDFLKWKLNDVCSEPLNLKAFVNDFCNINPPFHVAASYAWSSENDLNIRLHYVNWISSCRIQFHYNGNKVEPAMFMSSSDKRIRFNASVVGGAPVRK